MKNFIKKYLFFQVDKETRSFIHQKVFRSDLPVYIRTLIVIFFVQVIMGISNFSKYQDSDLPKYLVLVWFNVGLAIVCVILSILFKLFIKHNRNPYVVFFILNLALLSIMCWGIAVSCIDSIRAPNIVVFTYVSLVLMSMTTLAPWIAILDLAGGVLVLNLIVYFHEQTQWSSGFLINSLSVFFLGSLISIIAFARRIKALELEMENNKLNTTLSNNALTDELTQLKNRRFLSETMSDNLKVGDKPAGLILFDIDDFKKINDKYGHLNGDSILREIGKIVKSTRDYSYVVRYGGEEFLLFFDSINPQDLFDIAEYIRVVVKNNKFTLNDGQVISISISIGVNSAKENMTYNELIDGADDALYQSKKHGKNKVTIAE